MAETVESANSLLEDEAQEVTSAEVVSMMRSVWQSESVAPTLLPHRMELVECLLEQIASMEENLRQCDDKNHIKVSLHRFELQRLKYIVNSYLRIRLTKLEDNPHRFLKEHEARLMSNKFPLLTDEEVKFASEFAENHGSVIHKLITQQLPTSLMRTPVPAENLDVERVFAHVLESGVEDVAVPDGADPGSNVLVELEAGSTLMLPFPPIQAALEQGQVRLL